MKILIASDTHRKDGNLKQIVARTRHLNILIHLEDTEGSEHVTTSWVNGDYDLQMILGNNDFFSNLERKKDIMIGGYRALLTHGRCYNVSVGAEYLAGKARARGFGIAMFGHTRRLFYEVDREPGDRDLIVLNPDNLSYPRQDGHKPSHTLMKIDKKGETHLSLSFP